MGRRPIALFSPLPPARTGTADYAQSLLNQLTRIMPVEVVESEPLVPRLRTNTLNLYQIANNPHHFHSYAHALRTPGVVVLHEANLHDLVKEKTLQAGDREAYLREVRFELYGEGGERLATDTSWVDTPQARSFTMLRRVLEKAEGCIVHSKFVERQVRLKGFRGPIRVIPHGADILESSGKTQRPGLGLKKDDFVIGVFGYQRRDKLTWECIQAFRTLLDTVKNSKLLIVGQPHPDVPIADWVSRLGLQDSVYELGFQEPAAFEDLISCCDVIVNLRYPTYGETSGTVMRAFGLGRSVIVSDVGAFAELPKDACMQIPVDDLTEQVLCGCLEWLASNPAQRHEMGRRARNWVQDNCSWESVARRYADFLESIGNGSSMSGGHREVGGSDTQLSSHDEIVEYLRKWRVEGNADVGGLQKACLDSHQHRLARTLQMMGAATSDQSVLEMGCYLQITPALRDLNGYKDVRGCFLGKLGEIDRRTIHADDGDVFSCEIDLFDAERDVFPYSEESFDCVVCGELLDHLQFDPMHMMKEIHRVLRLDGLLVLTTPNAASWAATAAVLQGDHPGFYTRYLPGDKTEDQASRHAREYTPKEVSRLLWDAGFAVVRLDTGPYDREDETTLWARSILRRHKLPTELRGSCIYALARKAAATMHRYPQWLYDYRDPVAK